MDVLLQAAELVVTTQFRFHLDVAAQARKWAFAKTRTPYGFAGITSLAWSASEKVQGARAVLVQPQDLPQVLAFIRGETSSLESSAPLGELGRCESSFSSLC